MDSSNVSVAAAQIPLRFISYTFITYSAYIIILKVYENTILHAINSTATHVRLFLEEEFHQKMLPLRCAFVTKGVCSEYRTSRYVSKE